jgi:hypothetical protein
MDPVHRIKPFAWDDWPALWTIRFTHLAEHGIRVDPTAIPARPQPGTGDDHEWDFHHIDDVYLSGAGNFWLAWYNDLTRYTPGTDEIRMRLDVRACSLGSKETDMLKVIRGKGFY